jgi:AcrR family transcriptional regulator
VAHVRTPKQDRSRATLERILDATEALLDERGLDEITVSDIVGRAGSSVGSFYARFPGKDDLVDALMERYHQDVVRDLEKASADSDLKPLDLRAKARWFVEKVISTCRRRRGLLRLRLQLRLSGANRLPDERGRDVRVVSVIRELFLPCFDEITRSDPGEALTFALRLVDGVSAFAVLMEEVSGSYGGLSDEAAVEEVTHAFVSYLTGETR